MPDPDLSAIFHQLFVAAVDSGKDHAEAIHDAYQKFENAGLISKVTVHRYLCSKCGKPRATVIRLGDRTIARTTDYKFSRGYNVSHSAEGARASRTLDGNQHWPGHTYDIDELAAAELSFQVTCRHMNAHVAAAAVLALTRDVKAGHPGAPTRL
jgi:hypothetical protein